ncbi:MAG: hypothetical protein K6E54_02485, partial [Bacteroidaceae bacterium]|nr:hypothetical protein [Bacteroidaceae bacterium]
KPEPEKNVENILACVGSVINNDPLKADSLLSTIKPHYKNISEDLQMKYYIMYADAKNKLFDS